jgi:DNA-binding MarR family transcriptional regulator
MGLFTDLDSAALQHLFCLVVSFNQDVYRKSVQENVMRVCLENRFSESGYVSKHPEAQTIEDVITFRLQRLVALGERAVRHWSERMFDLSLNEWRLLALVQARSPSRAGDIADLLLMDKSQTSRIIKVLLKRGLIRNFPDPNDGRAIALELTQEGEVLYSRAFEEVMRNNERILEVLSVEEVQVFDIILTKLVSHSSDLLRARLRR